MLCNNNQHQHSHKESRRESRDISGIVIKLPLESSCRNKFLHHGWLVENGRSDKKQTLVNTCTIKIRKKPSSTHIGRKSESVLVIWDSLIKFKHQHEKCDMEVSSLQNTHKFPESQLISIEMISYCTVNSWSCLPSLNSQLLNHCLILLN